MFISSTILGALLFTCSVLAQGPNTIYRYNENLRTMATNGSYFIVPVNTITLQKIVPYPLLRLPTDRTLFPKGFPTGAHPVLVSSSLGSDIRMGPLTVAAILNGQVYVPYVDVTKDGKSAIVYPIRSIISALNNVVLQSIIPTLGAGIDGSNSNIGHFTPANIAYTTGSPSTIGGKIVILSNPLNPSVTLSLYDLQFTTTSTPLYTARTFKAILNQPLVLNTGMCLRNAMYFNGTDANVVLRTGRVELYEDYAALPSGLGGVYKDAGGLTGASQTVGYNPETCSVAVARVDSAALA